MSLVLQNTGWAERLVRFINASPSPYHAVECIKGRLVDAGFTELLEAADWRGAVRAGEKYFTTRNGSSIIAFVIPSSAAAAATAAPSAVGFTAAAAHVDSPCLRVRPVSAKAPREGMVQVGVETYGGGLWHTWFDRDLAVAGRVQLRSHDGSVLERLVRSARPIMRVPTLAIHLDRTVHEAFKFNTESHLLPILATHELNDKMTRSAPGSAHNAGLIQELLQDDSKMPHLADVLAVDLCLHDAQPACLGGLHNEFVFAPRLDNLGMSFCLLEGLLQATSEGPDSSMIKTAVWFDHEEVGSESTAGALGGLMESVFTRICSILGADYHRSMAQSIIVSADMAHATHPNYPEKHEECMRPRLHHGVVIKYNAGQRYATSSRTAAAVKTMMLADNVPLQEFEVRNDSPCGSTVGPMLAAGSGCPTIDVGLAQLSMHSIREMSSAVDVEHGVRFMSCLFSKFNCSGHRALLS